MIVIDASAAVDYLTADGSSADWLRHRVEAEPMVHVPALFDLEVLQALRGLEAAGALPPDALELALLDLADLRAVRHGHEHLRSRIWSLRHNLTAYDASYLALAELLDVPLITTDAGLAQGAEPAARIEMPPA